MEDLKDTLQPNYVQQVKDDLKEYLPECDDRLLDLYALLVLVLGTKTTMIDIHDAWSVWKNMTDPTHKSLVLFSELSEEVRELDRKYMDVVHTVASAMADKIKIDAVQLAAVILQRAAYYRDTKTYRGALAGHRDHQGDEACYRRYLSHESYAKGIEATLKNIAKVAGIDEDYLYSQARDVLEEF